MRRPQLHVRADDGERADLAAGIDLGARLDDGGGVDGHVALLQRGYFAGSRSASIAMNSASATTCPSTIAGAVSFQTGALLLRHLDVELEPIAGHHRPAELRAVDRP